MEHWRVGTSEATGGRTIYRHSDDGPPRGELVGVMLDARNAALAVRMVNRLLMSVAADEGYSDDDY